MKIKKDKNAINDDLVCIYKRDLWKIVEDSARDANVDKFKFMGSKSVRSEFIKKLRQWMKENPDGHMVSLTVEM